MKKMIVLHAAMGALLSLSAYTTSAQTMEVIFSNEPFEGDNPTNKKLTAFKAWDEIYGRVNFGKPIKDLLTGTFEDVNYNGHVVIAIMMDENKDEQYGSAVEKRLTKEDIEKTYFDFDIAPAVNKSRDYYITNFGSEVASYGNEHFQNREKTTFYVSIDRREEKMYSGGLMASFTLDYSNLPDGDDGTTKISEWQRMINQAADEEQIKTNLKKLSKKATIQFSTTPFNGSPVVSASFKAGAAIYGRITLDKPLKEYLNGKLEPTDIQIDIKCLNDNLYGIAVEKNLRASEYENAFIDFDILPTSEKAIDVYRNNLGFYRTFCSSSIEPGRTLKFEISLATETNMSYKGFRKIEAWGEMEVDYTGATRPQIQTWSAQAEKALEAAEKNASIVFAKESSELVKNLALPTVFTWTARPGYASITKAALINIIKVRYKITEVYMLTFAEPTAAGDFTVWKDDYGYPTEKRGHHYFYFVFKDTDGYFKFTGGVLSQPYEGGGKYGAPILLPWTAIQEGDPKFPHDAERQKKGYEMVFFFDAGKVKK
ncbi:MAG: hypothetical protein ACHQF2_00495 [Flavobacteriales bacterium]